MPLKIVIFEDEDHAHKIWGQNHVLVRADGHVAWRGSKVPDNDTAEKILMVVTGQERFEGYGPEPRRKVRLQGTGVDLNKPTVGDVQHYDHFSDLDTVYCQL
ncbi:hypothetical protein V1504DRAFT_64595 [Lipomyces starkeyi]